MDGYFLMGDDEASGTIVIADDLDVDGTVAVFLEEYAHARTAYLMDEEDEDEDPYHHATFWAELGRITHAYRRTLC